VYTHLTALVIPAIQIIILLYLRHKDEVSRKVFNLMIWNLVFVIILYLPWLVHFFITKLSFLSSGTAWYFQAKAPAVFFLSLPLQALVGSGGAWLSLISLFVFLFIIGAGLFDLKRSGSRKWLLTSKIDIYKWTAIFMVLAPTFLLFSLGLYTLRFYVIIGVGLALLLAFGLVSFESKKIKYIYLLALTASLLFPVANSLVLPDPLWPQLAQYIKTREKKDDKIITAYPSDFLSLKYYYRGDLEVSTLVDSRVKQESRDDLELVLRTNAAVYLLDFTAEELDGLLGSASRVWFVFDRATFADTYQVLVRFFLERGWQRAESYPVATFSSQEAWLLQKGGD